MVRRVRKSYICHYFSKLFKARILGLIFHRFRKLFGLIFPTFWHHFSILFRHRFFIEFLMSFLTTLGRKWGPILWAGASILRPFSRPRFRHRFGRHFCTILGPILVACLSYFRLTLLESSIFVCILFEVRF